MIQETDLRIGNYVLYSGHYRKIVSLNLGTDVNAEPILLSEEMLLKCGFHKSRFDNDKFEHTKGYQVIRYKDEWLFRIIGCTISEVPYIHKLQNIYYEIEGEELQINL